MSDGVEVRWALCPQSPRPRYSFIRKEKRFSLFAPLKRIRGELWFLCLGHIPLPRLSTVAQGVEHYYYLDLGHVLTLCLEDGTHGTGSLQKLIVWSFYYPSKEAKMLEYINICTSQIIMIMVWFTTRPYVPGFTYNCISGILYNIWEGVFLYALMKKLQTKGLGCIGGAKAREKSWKVIQNLRNSSGYPSLVLSHFPGWVKHTAL